MEILYKFATRSRPDKFKSAIDNILSLSKHDDFTILVSADTDDAAMNNAQMIAWCASKANVLLVFGTSKNKVDAINRQMPFCDFDILINVSDDMRFLVPGFDLRIIEGFGGNYDQFLHYPDGHTGNAVCTMSIIGGQYYDRDGYIYHPDYKSLWCDNEATEVAKKRLCYRWINESIFTHDHPAWTQRGHDDLLRKNESYYYEDQKTYELRKAAGFPKHSVL